MGEPIFNHISGMGHHATFSADADRAKVAVGYLDRTETNLIHRLNELGKAEFKKDLAVARLNGEEYFASRQNIKEVYSPKADISFINFDLLRGGLDRMAVNNPGSTPSRSKDINWSMLGVVVALVIGSVTIAIMKGWL